MPLVAEHKERLRAARPHPEAGWAHRLEPDRKHAAPDGNGKIVATERELIHIGDNGGIIKIEPNGGPTNWLVNSPMGAVLVGDSTPAEIQRRYRGAPIINLGALNRPTAATDLIVLSPLYEIDEPFRRMRNFLLRFRCVSGEHRSDISVTVMSVC